MTSRLRDLDIRKAAHARLLAHAKRCPETLVVDELGLEHGASRVDIAVINGHIRAFEIKAEADTLERLPRQITAYGKVVDKATLIADKRHIAAAEAMLPHWWGIISVSRTASGSVQFRRLRNGRSNPDLDKMSLARLLWKSEVADALRALGADERLLRNPRAILYAALVDLVSSRRLREIVRTTLKQRTNWRDRELPLRYDGSCRPSAMS